jgi:hypothetical protein
VAQPGDLHAVSKKDKFHVVDYFPGTTCATVSSSSSDDHNNPRLKFRQSSAWGDDYFASGAAGRSESLAAGLL